VVCGLLTATFLSLFLVPALYALLSRHRLHEGTAPAASVARDADAVLVAK